MKLIYNRLTLAIRKVNGTSPAQVKNQAKDELIKRMTHYIEWGE